MILGKQENGHSVSINLDRLIESRLLLQANSGGGKSWALRRILEQTHGKVQQIVIDVEDEFHTLREKFDYVLAGSTGGDCPADVRTAPHLARRLLELNVSAIIGIFELKAHDRIRFVRHFLDAMVNAPRELWHPVLVVVDEAHIFCPQHGEAESAGAVIDLMTRGRKRGFCGILATQRISKLHKDAAAEANNKLIGRSALDVDMKRAADELGFSSRDEQLTLRTLKPGEFFAFGPALSDVVTGITVGDIVTSHPRAGHRTAPPPPPRGAVKQLLEKLADLPREAEAEARTVAELQKRVRELESHRSGVVVKVQASPDLIEKARLAVEREWRGRYERLQKAVSAALSRLQSGVAVAFSGLEAQLKPLEPSQQAPRAAIPKPPTEREIPARAESAIVGNGGLKRMLNVLAQYPEGRTRKQLAILAGLSPNSGTFSTYLGQLRSNGFIEGSVESLRITPAGLESLGPVEPLPEGAELFEYWCKEVGGGMERILRALRDGGTFGREDLANAAGLSASSGTFSTYLGRLRTLELIRGSSDISLAEELL